MGSLKCISTSTIRRISCIINKLRNNELFNACTMLSPCIALIKYWKTSSLMRIVMCFHLPVSVLYHISCAFKNNIHTNIIRLLRSLDTICIHITSITSHCEFVKKVNTISYILHTLILVSTLKRSMYSYKVPLMQYTLFFSDNIHFYNLNYKKACIITTISSSFFMFYLMSSKNPYFHGIFHIGLYWLYKSYFEFYNDITPLQ